MPAALVNTLYDRQPPIVLTAEGAGGTITYSALGLPGGITYDSGSGELSGTPTQQGEFPVTFTATDGSETITLDLTFIVLPATGGDVSQIVVNFWVTRASLKLGEDGKESWRVSAIYNADRRTGNRFDPSTDLFRALLGSHVLQVDPGECTGSVPDQACSYKSASGEVPVEGAKLTPDKQTLAWSTGSDTIAETVPGVLSQTVTLGDDAWRVLLRFDEKGGFRPALAFERTAFVLSKGSISLKGPGLDSAKLSLLLADPEPRLRGRREHAARPHPRRRDRAAGSRLHRARRDPEDRNRHAEREALGLVQDAARHGAHEHASRWATRAARAA